MDIKVIADLLKGFARRHKTTFDQISSRQSMQLELAAVVGVQEHYRASGFDINVINPPQSSQFVVKTSTRGMPWSYSKIRATRGNDCVEIHMNLLVRGAHDNGIYCVDIGVVKPGAVPDSKDAKKKWICLENRHLQSFAEAKRLAVYPMLLAQFFGIVHEIKPRFARPPPRRNYGKGTHIPPTLIVLGRYSGNSTDIVTGFQARDVQINIAENFDVRVAWARKELGRSPLYWDDDEVSKTSARQYASITELPAA